MIVFVIVIHIKSHIEMKRAQKTSAPPATFNQVDSDIDNDCSCEILLDDSLSNVGDSDCDCSQCLEANLNAFNQLKTEDQNTINSTKELLSKRNTRNSNSATRIKHPNTTNKQSQPTVHRYKSSERIPNQHKNTNRPKFKIQNEEISGDNFDEFLEGGQFSNGQLNDFLMVTRNRTRKYIEERNELEDFERQKKEELKEKIKKNLQMLKYTASIVAKTNEPQSKQLHAFKWNHSKYKCECNGEVDHKRENQNCCRKSCRKLKIKEGLDTNLKQLKPDFGTNRQEILNEIKKKRDQIIEAQKKQSCPDKCPNHHNRTEKQKIKKIQSFIQKNAEKHKKKLIKMKKEEQEKKRALQGKLTAIDIKSKQILKRSKKYDENQSRTSFRDSIEQYDTFSELRDENERRKKIKQDRKNMKTNPKIKEQLLEKVYEDVEEDWEQAKNTDQYKYTTKGQMPQVRKQQDFIDRIAYDAGITAPKNIKQPKKQTGQEKKTNTKVATKQKTEQAINLNKRRQEEEKKRVQEEIAKKKMQIMEQFKKRNTNFPQNKEIRESYHQKLEQNTKKKKVAEPQQKHTSKEPYRANYQTKAGKNSDQIRAHGDPLIQEYTYHQEKQKAAARKGGEDMQIFSSNVGTLLSKKKLAP